MATLKYKEGGVVKELILPASGIKLLDIENNFQSKNLEEVLKEIGETESVYLGEIDPNKEGIWFDSSDQLNTGDDNTVVSRIKDYINTENTYEANATTSNEVTTISEDLQKQIKITNVQGQTNYNLLGAMGDCETTSGWYGGNLASGAIDTNTKIYGNSIKVTSTADAGEHFFAMGTRALISPNKYYCLSGYIKAGSGNAYLRPITFTSNNTLVNDYGSVAPKTNDSTKFVRTSFKFQSSTAVNFEVRLMVANASDSAYFDLIMLEEITQAQYNDANFQPSPYVSGDLSVGENATKIKTKGKNIGEGYFSWGYLNSSTSYVPTGTSTDSTTRLLLRVPVKENTAYTFSCSQSNRDIVMFEDANRNIIGHTGSEGTTLVNNCVKTFTTPLGCKFATVYYAKVDGTTILVEPTNVQLEEGSVATTYEPYTENYINLNVPLRSLPNGTKDEIKDGKLIKRVEKVTFENTQYSWSVASSGTGFKELVAFIDGNASNYSELAIKHNGRKIIPSITPNSASDQSAMFNGTIHITVSLSDSGWADSYTPSSAEILAYFLGWKMFDYNTYTSTTALSTTTATWSGTGTKGWVALSGSGSNTGTLPTYVAPGVTPYKLFYSLQKIQTNEISLSNLIAYTKGNLVMESDFMSFVRPSITYKIVDSLKTNINELEKILSDTERIAQKNKEDIAQISNPNLLINGDFQVWQRGTSFSASPGMCQYTADRWHEWSYNVGKTATVTKGNGCLIWGTISNNGLRQCIETNVNGREMTYSVQIRGNVGDAINLSITDDTAPTNELRTIASNTFYCTGGIDTFTLYVPKANYTKYCTVRIISPITTTYNIFWAKLEYGNKATPFVPRTYADELQMCRRYFECVTSGNETYTTMAYNNNFYGIIFMVKKRVSPTVKLWSYNGVADNITLGTFSNNGCGDIATGSVSRVNAHDIVYQTSANSFVKGDILTFQYSADAEIL